MKFVFGLFIVIAFFFLLAGGFIYLNSEPDKLTDSQKEEAINQMLGRKSNLNPNVKTGNTKFEGKYISFDYPASAEIYGYKDPATANDVMEGEQLSFDLINPRLVFNYTLKKSSSVNDLDDIPAVKLREDSARGYQKSEIKADGESGLVFSKDRSGEFPAETSGFFLINGKIYTISVTGSSLQDIDKLFNQVINSITFLN